MALRTLSLFSGGGGLDLGIELAVPEARVLCYVEREAYAAACLVARMEEGSLAPAPVWSDVTTFDGRPWRGRVDLISGGFPCQDISVAGKGAGLAGERSGLWKEYARIVSEVRPRLVFIENVSALRSRGLDRVLSDLAALGFDAEWGCFRASDVGAPHRRERIFILAYAAGTGRGSIGSHYSSIQERSHDGCGTLGNAQGKREGRLPSLWRRTGEDQSDPDGDEQELGDTNNKGLEGFGESFGEGSNQRSPWPPGPEERDHWREYLRVSPHLEPAICRGPHGLARGLEYRTDRLRLLGNGVVPADAALAFRTLMDRVAGG